MSNILDEILVVKRDEILKLRKGYKLSRFKDSIHFEKSRLSLAKSITSNSDISIIAEIKKASPSKGIIRKDFDHLKIAEIYFENEVAAISVLTDKNFFKGDIQFLNDIANIKSSPLLRKDFIIDEFQVYEAKSNGADVILLIAEALSKSQIQELSCVAYETDLEVLLELHSEEQLTKIDFGLNKIIGINNRNLNNFTTSLDTTILLSSKIPNDNFIISESGIHTKNDVDKLKEYDIKGALIGEHFMRQENISDSVKQMKEWCSRES